jgi:hypothetical protein
MKRRLASQPGEVRGRTLALPERSGSSSQRGSRPASGLGRRGRRGLRG